MEKNSFMLEKKVFILVIMTIGAIITFVLFAAIINFPIDDFSVNPINNSVKNSALNKFSSEEDFKSYMENSSKMPASFGGNGIVGMMENKAMPGTDVVPDGIGGGGEPERVSDTNVQIRGIDEPDIVKTDGKEIYFSGEPRLYFSPMLRSFPESDMAVGENQKMIPPYPYPTPQAETKIIKAFPPADLALDGKINMQGDLLLDKNNLIVFPNNNYYGAGQEIAGYNVSDPKSPQKKWSVKLENNAIITASRLFGGKIYLVARNNINTIRPCPIEPMSIDGAALNIKCADIYHPIMPVPVDSVFNAMILDPGTGKIEKTVSFVGSYGSSIVYVSENAIYATYTYNESAAKFFSDFVKENVSLFPVQLSQKIAQLEKYDISENSKISEITLSVQKYAESLNEDERLEMQNEMINRMSDYYKKHNRELEKTGIVKIDLSEFNIASNGSVLGHLLNNFAMDEYQGNLRVATTVGSQWGVLGGLGRSESFSDIYVLDKNLKTIGLMKDLGKTEQIYSVRFVEDKGYLVTFRQTDPFYVLDLADPKNPAMAGELKIPGFSSYLHPLDATHILGVGMESGKVKISLFDVSDKNNPAELDKYLLDEYWTEVANNYHAFLLDKKHNIFFLPGSKGGYIFSYGDKIFPIPGSTSSSKTILLKLSLKKAVSQNSVKRAIYINDYLYIIGEDKITVLNENDWTEVNKISL